MFQTAHAPTINEPAPDGSNVYPLVRTERATAGIIELRPGEVTSPVRHRTIEEIWYVIGGEGELWRRLNEYEERVPLAVGTCVTIPTDASFQFRATRHAPLRMLMFTVPPWPGNDEAMPCDGPWEPEIRGR